MTKTNSPDEHEHHTLGERLKERILAAEVAAEEAAEFGPGTSLVEAAEGAADPERESREGDVAEEQDPKQSSG